MLARIFEVMQPKFPEWLTLQMFEQIYADWNVVPLTTSGKTVGAVICKGPELHVVYFEPPVFSIIKHIRQTLKRIVDEYGHAETLVEPWNEQALKFCRRLGFEECGMKGDAIYMRCEVLHHVRQK